MIVHRLSIVFSMLISLALPSSAVIAAETPKEAEKSGEKEKKEPEKPAPEVKPVVTQHEIQIGGKPLRYTATAGPVPLPSGCTWGPWARREWPWPTKDGRSRRLTGSSTTSRRGSRSPTSS